MLIKKFRIHNFTLSVARKYFTSHSLISINFFFIKKQVNVTFSRQKTVSV
jgi:hypothetical protein